MRNIFLLFLCMVTSGLFYSQEVDPLLKLHTAKLHFKRYVWGDEFFFILKGTAHKSLANTKLTLEIKYFDKIASSYTFVLSPKRKKYFSISVVCGPLNEPYQKILAGDYSASIFLQTKIQVPKIRKRFLHLNKKKHLLFEKKMFWKDQKIFEKENKEIKAFYLQKIKILSDQYNDLLNSSKEAFSIKSNLKYGQDNRFLDSKKETFSPQLWRAWLGKFQKTLQQELHLLQKWNKKIYCERYSIPEKNLEEFVFILLRYSRILTIRMHEYYKVKVDIRDTKRVDPFGISKEQGIINHLTKLLLMAKKSLKEANR